MWELIKKHPIRTTNIVAPVVTGLVALLQSKGVIDADIAQYLVVVWGAVVMGLTGAAMGKADQTKGE